MEGELESCEILITFLIGQTREPGTKVLGGIIFAFAKISLWVPRHEARLLLSY